MRPTTRLGAGSFRRQIVILTACVTAFAMALLALVLQLILADFASSTVDRVLEDRADAVASATISASTDTVVVPTADLDAGIVVYDAAGTLVAGASSERLRQDFEDLATSTTTVFRTVGDTDRVIGLPFTTAAGDSAVVVVAERLAPYEEAEFLALIASLATGTLATLAAAAIASYVTTRALRPVAVLASTAAQWSEHDLGRRFALGEPTNEITALAATLDTLLDKVSTAIHSEQRLTSELAHELRTPLTAVQGTADLALLDDDLSPEGREALEEISEAGHRMAATITALLEVARTEASMRDASSSSISAVVEDVLAALPADGPAVRVDVLDHRIAAPRSIAVRALAPLVANAFRFAHSRVSVSTSVGADGHLRVVVEDDGPGVLRDTEEIFRPGITTSGGSGAGLGLSIARRMARSVGGDIELTSRQAPTRFVLRLPSS